MPARSAIMIVLAALLAAAGLAAITSGEPARDGAMLEIQSGPVSLILGMQAEPVVLAAKPCLQTGCPLLAVRLPASSAALQGAPGEAGRVQRLQPAAFQGGRLPVQSAGDVLGEERGVGEAPRAQGAENEGRRRDRDAGGRPI